MLKVVDQATAALLSMLVANPLDGGIEVRWNGKPIGPIGPKGQVRKVVFTPERFEIIDPRKNEKPL